VSYQARIVERDGKKCRACGRGNPLEVHHIVYRSRGGTDEDSNLITLCRGCHVKAHESKLAVWELQAMVISGKSLLALQVTPPALCVNCQYRLDTNDCIMMGDRVPNDFTCPDWKLREDAA
jgi:hypothetical protein